MTKTQDITQEIAQGILYYKRIQNNKKRVKKVLKSFKKQFKSKSIIIEGLNGRFSNLDVIWIFFFLFCWELSWIKRRPFKMRSISWIIIRVYN